MLYKNVASQKIAVFAYTPADGAAKTGDAAQITAYLSKDFAAGAATNDTNPTELDGTNMPGWYVFDLTQAETNAEVIVLAPKSSTSGVVLDQIQVFTQDAAISSRASQTSVDDVPTVSEFEARTLPSADYTVVSDLPTPAQIVAAIDVDPPAVNVTMWQGDPVNDLVSGSVEAQLAATQGAVTFGQVKVLANVAGEGALHIVNSSVVGKGQHISGALYGVHNLATQIGGVATYNQATGANSYGVSNIGQLVGVQSSGGSKAVDGVDSQGIRDAMKLAPSAGAPAAGSVDAKLDDILTTIGSEIVEGTYTRDDILRIIAAALAGKTSGSGTATVEILGLDGATTRIIASVDGVGNRTAMTLDGAA